MEILLIEKCTGDLVTVSVCKIHDWDVRHFAIRRQSGVLSRTLPEPTMNTLMLENDTYEFIGVL
jgi:hypothetical protein